MILLKPTDDLAENLGAIAFDLPEDAQLYLLLDASSSPEIHVYLDAFPDPATCLFGGELGENAGEVAPWLAAPSRYGDMFDWFAEEGWGKNWGVLIQSRLPMAKLKTHLKKFLMVELESGEKNFFKFYRPRHLATFMPLLEGADLQRFMKGIDAYLIETPNDAMQAVRYSMNEDGALLTRREDLRSQDGS